jgi:DNA-binding HxlR family transcriptional regulator
MSTAQRSECPINLALEILGDRWTLLIVRDIVFAERRYFRELLTQSDEGIASNVLADRLKRLVEAGVLTRAEDPDHKQKARYSLTEMGIGLVPLLAQLGTWGRKHLPSAPELGAPSKVLEDGGARALDRFMTELRAEHLGAGGPGQRSMPKATIRDEFSQAYLAALA